MNTTLVNKSFVALFAMLFMLFAGMQAAEAKRFGGGKSFGFQKQMAPKKPAAPKQTQSPPNASQASGGAKTSGAKASGASKWMGPLAGLAAGGLLAAMLFGDGFEDFAIMDFLLIALVLFVLFKLFTRRKAQTQQNYAGHGFPKENTRSEAKQDTHQHRASVAPSHPPYDANQSGSLIGSAVSQDAIKVPEQPSWFDEAGFIENAKLHFVQVQKAWDDSNVNEIREYCSPELFAAIGAEMSGMKPGENVTVVEDLDAEVAEMAIDGDYFIVSVRFSGFIQESVTEDAHAFKEIWHIRRLASDSGDWQIAGIQQIQL